VKQNPIPVVSPAPQAPSPQSEPGTPISIALVATCPPRQCGIATFSSDLARSIRAADPTASVSWAAIDNPRLVQSYGPEVRWKIEQGNPASYQAAAQALNASDVDVVALQHEFGLYGAWNGGFVDHLEPFLRVLRKPLVTTLHTVLPEPHPSQRRAIQRIGDKSTNVVVMAETARRLLVREYGVPVSRIRVIPHGVPPMPAVDREQAKANLGIAGHTVVATFGLVDPRKGLEYAIRAMQAVVADHPDALYLILGRTHPEFVRTSGESYRTELTTLVESLGLAENVRFIDRYLTNEDVVAYLRATDVYVTPYLDPNQITSGTLAYALGAGRAIISTPYLHAAEVLAEGRGILVDFRSEQALADGLKRVLGDPSLRTQLEDSAYAYGRQTFWPIVVQSALGLYRDAAAAARTLSVSRYRYSLSDQRWRRPLSERKPYRSITSAGLSDVERSGSGTYGTRRDSLN